MAWTFGALEQAISDMAYDNGAINVGRSEGYVLTKVRHALEQKFSEDDLRKVNRELDQLDDGQFEALNGDSEEAPILTDLTRTVLAEAFDSL